MFAGMYRFAGDPVELALAYDRLRAMIPAENLELHVCVVADGGLTIIDTCPDKETFLAFSSGSDFASAVRTAGLPTPVIEPLGTVHATRIGDHVTSIA